MSRLPFDPDKSTGPDESLADTPGRRERAASKAAGDDGPQQLTVNELSNLIKATLEQRIESPLRVVGQVSNLKTPNHWYFSLKDEQAVIACAAWASSASRFSFRPKEGDEIIATGHISHYGSQGKTQLYVSKIEPVGAGALELQFRALCEQLRALGYFDDERKKPLPLFPQRIAVITSATGAAVQDVISTAAQRCKAVGLVIVDVRVQGEAAKEEIARAIQWVDANHQQLGVDAILVTRGGGSLEDLWAFNERIVADAAYNCSIPLVAAIGHESDTTLIELIADQRCSTPTQAAMRLVPAADELHKQVDHYQHRLNFLVRRCVEQQSHRLTASHKHLHSAIRHGVSDARSRLERLANRLAHLKPHVLLSDRHRRLAVLQDRLERAIHRRVDQREMINSLRSRLDAALQARVQQLRQQVDARERALIAVDPRQVLRRGYSYTTKTDGSLVRSIKDVTNGDTLLTNVADGTIRSVAGGSSRKRRKNTQSGPEQMDLFGADE